MNESKSSLIYKGIVKLKSKTFNCSIYENTQYGYSLAWWEIQDGKLNLITKTSLPEVVIVITSIDVLDFKLCTDALKSILKRFNELLIKKDEELRMFHENW